MPLNVGEIFAGFTVLQLLGSGGMGEVYLVRHPRLSRNDALKILPRSLADDPDYRRRFDREADAAAALWHPHIVGVHDRGEYEGQLWISMDYVAGADAAHLLRERYPQGMPPEEVINVVSAVAEALDYAHDRGLMHRDVKPANILLTGPATGKPRVLLADFGIARRFDDTSGLTATNTTLGTLNYSAPEQLLGENMDGRTDQYALAATAFHLFGGEAPDAHSNAAVVITRRLNGPPPRLSELRPGLRDFDGALTRAMSQHQIGRFASCTEFATALSAALAAPRRPFGHGATAAPPTQLAHTPTTTLQPKPPSAEARPTQRGLSPVAWGLLGLGVLLAVALVLVGVLLSRGPSQQSAPALVVPSTPLATVTPPESASSTVTSSVSVGLPPTKAQMVLPDADAHGFTVYDGGARCAGADRADFTLRTDQSALVICQSETGARYYRGYRLSDGATIELGTVYSAPGGFVAVNAPDNARYEISSVGLRIIQNGNVISTEPAVESSP